MILSIIVSLLTSCQSKKNESNIDLSSEEKVWLKQFFEDLMLFESGIYTLWGSKPITLVVIEKSSDEEKRAIYDSLTEEEKKSCQICIGYSFDKTWFQWEKIQHRFRMHRYMLFKVDSLEDDGAFFILFADALKTAAIIQENYDEFRKVIGADFHPLELTLSLKEKDSILWKKLKGNAHLWGILFGFGKMNSYLFQWKYFDHPESCIEFCENIVSYLHDDPIREYAKYTIDEFPIPAFASFNAIDPVVDNFLDERNRIKQIYKVKVLGFIF